MQTIAIVANVFNEVNALPGWIESAHSFADWVGVIHAGPRGLLSDDGTIDLLKKHGVPFQQCAIDDGFGVVRTKTLRMVPPMIDWIMLLDADERFNRDTVVMTCSGESTPCNVVDSLLYDYGNPNFAKDGPRDPQIVQPYDSQIDFGACPSNFENMRHLGANLRVQCGERYDQAEWLRGVMENEDIDAIKVIRRHWHDLTHTRPTQNWHTDPDYQMRLLRNKGSIYFAQDTRMHERVVGVKAVHEPEHTRGPFFDHYHLFFKRMEAEQRRHDIAVYNAIDKGESPPSFEEWRVS